MEVEIMQVKGDINSFMSGNMEISLHGVGYNNLTVSETEEFNEHLSEILSLLRVGAIRKLRESEEE